MEWAVVAMIGIFLPVSGNIHFAAAMVLALQLKTVPLPERGLAECNL